MSEQKIKTLQFIKDYKKHQELWDWKHKDYTNKRKRTVAFKALSVKYNMSVKNVKSKIKSLRTYFCKEHQRITKTIDGDPNHLKWFAYDHLYFILNSEPKNLRMQKLFNDTAESFDIFGGMGTFQEMEGPVIFDDTPHNILQPVVTGETIEEAHHQLGDDGAYVIKLAYMSADGSPRVDHMSVPRSEEPGDESSGRLQCKEVFWWEGIQLVPPRQPFGLLGKLYTSNTKFNPNARPGSPVTGKQLVQTANGTSTSVTCPTPERRELKQPKSVSGAENNPRNKQGATGCGDGTTRPDGDSADDSEQSSDSSDSSDSARSDEDSVPRRRLQRAAPVTPLRNKRTRVVGRQWIASLSARSNQDGQRRFEERAATQMRAALARRHAQHVRAKPIPGGVYARLEAEWREKFAPRSRSGVSARPRPTAAKYK